MSKEISKSPEMVQKEATINELHKQLIKTRRTLKGLKTRLANTQQEISDVQLKVSSQYFRMMEDMDDVRQEIIGLLNKLIKLKSLMPEERKQMKIMKEEMGESEMGEEYEKYKEHKVKLENGDFDFDENQRAKMRDLFAEFRVKPNEEEQRNIRKVFIKLSTHFHPDKAKNEKEAELFHRLMQEINEAYQQGDVDKLLEIEQLNLETEMLDYQSKAITVDVLQQEIVRLNRDLNYLQNQIERTSAEIKDLRKSDLGKMLTSLNKAKKEGDGMDEMLDEMQDSLTHLTKIRDGLAQAEKDGNLSGFYQQMMSQMPGNPFEEMGMDEDDIGDFLSQMGGFEDDDYNEPIKRPKFKIGSSVQVNKNVNAEFDSNINMKNWEGRVIDAYRNEEGDIYEVEFDSITMQNMPQDYIEKLVEFDYDFSEYQFSPNDLIKAKSRDTQTETNSSYRQNLHQYKWYYLDEDEDKELMLRIMTQMPEESDEENWKLYFRNNLSFPFDGEVKGMFHLAPNSKVEVIGLDGWDEFGGMIVVIKNQKMVTQHPLFDFSAKGVNAKHLDIYFQWAQDMLIGFE
ncbi:MAG: hypothetical protein ACJAT4_000184 [Granulosicoccus sp.]|jgi:hypothetical protein